ncbi:hypothetical protein GE09DRAFT_216613 [Coniochaeta sp. 2T2.1]|nr:hypothetical protein GE09DRAFT_216613 [Coniochaeta sp. 2T2.1]
MKALHLSKPQHSKTAGPALRKEATLSTSDTGGTVGRTCDRRFAKHGRRCHMDHDEGHKVGGPKIRRLCHSCDSSQLSRSANTVLCPFRDTNTTLTTTAVSREMVHCRRAFATTISQVRETLKRAGNQQQALGRTPRKTINEKSPPHTGAYRQSSQGWLALVSPTWFVRSMESFLFGHISTTHPQPRGIFKRLQLLLGFASADKAHDHRCDEASRCEPKDQAQIGLPVPMSPLTDNWTR